MGDKVYWTCRDHALHGCRSRAITQGQRVTVMRSHCHSPDMEGLQARRQQEKATPAGPGGYANKLSQGIHSPVCHQGPGAPTVTKSRPRKKAKVSAQIQALQGPPEEDQDADLGEPLSLGAFCLRSYLRAVGRLSAKPPHTPQPHLHHLALLLSDCLSLSLQVVPSSYEPHWGAASWCMSPSCTGGRRPRGTRCTGRAGTKLAWAAAAAPSPRAGR